ncbi:MAG: hypothetical protein NC228_10470, partial [[Eubacterium] siraeum]|nr:hypothetical protein [[Eubacterium] siraeum]
QLINMIAGGSSENGMYETDSPEFAEIYDFVKNIYEKNNQKMQLILITVMPALGKTPAVSDRDEAMDYLQKAISITVNDTAITFRFSSVQCMVIITDPDKENADSVTDRILNSFYKSYDKKNMALTTEAACLPPVGA